MWSLDDHEIRVAANPSRKWKVKQAIGDAEALCRKAEAAEPLARQLLERILVARDTLARAYDNANEVARRRWLRAFEDALVAFSDALRPYCVKLFVDRVLLHQRVVADLKSIHGDLDRLFQQLHNDENRKSDWQEAFATAVEAFGKAVETHVNDEKTREAYEKDSRLSLEAAVLVRVAQKSADRLLWHENPLAQCLWDANKEWKDVVVPDWFIRESTVSLLPKVVAKGGFGVVYRGTWGSATKVVVKRLLMGDYADHAIVRDQLMKEADLWFRMTHPNVLRLCGACHVAESPFFVSEDAQEGDLSEYLTRDKSKVWRQLFQTALAIEYLHEKGIIHRDLKLNNVFVFTKGQVRLADFGLSGENAAGGAGAVDGSEAGALRWRAPEALDGICRVESDVYSFALCIIEAITGKTPYWDLNDDAAADRIRRAVLPDLPEDTRDEVRDLVTKMTTFAPTERMKIKDVISVLKKLANEEQNQDAASSLMCQKCCVSVPNGSKWCQKCQADIAETGSTSIRSAEDVPHLIQMAMLSDGQNNRNTAKVLCDYLRSHPEGWFAVLEAGAIPVLRKIVRESHDKDFAADALKALGLLIMASSMAPHEGDADIAHRKMQSILNDEKVAELFKTQLASDSDDMKCIAVKTLGFWPYREEITVDSDLMARIRKMADNAGSSELRRSASFALQALAPDTPAAA